MQLSRYVEEVLAVAALIPRGRVMSYGDIAEYVGTGGPRQVGLAMARYGGGVAWWRVVHADGSPAACHDGAAFELLRDEDTPMRPAGDRVDMRRARWTGPADGAVAG